MEKLTKKEVERLAANGKIYAVGYCKAQHLLTYQNRHGYNSGVYGWNYDVFVLGDNVIITGYNPFKANKIDAEKLTEYEKKARYITKNDAINYIEKEKQVNELLKSLLD